MVLANPTYLTDGAVLLLQRQRSLVFYILGLM